MAINTHSLKDPAQTDEPDVPQSAEGKRLQREKERAQKKLDDIKKRQETLQIRSAIFEAIRTTAYKIAQPVETNEEPADLFMREDILPVLKKMNIANIAEKRKTVLLDTKKEGMRHLINLYKILIRRKDAVTPDNIERIKREIENLQDIKWSNDGIEFYVWGEPYLAPEEEKKPAPGPTPVPPTPPGP